MYIPEIKEEINENDKMLVVGEDGKVHIVDVPENGASVWEDIKNKPFGEEEILVTIVPETTIENAEKYTNDVFSPADLIYGETYIVTWDGVEYECVCTSYSGNGVGSTSVLNTVIESYEYPFWIFYNGMVAVVETGKTHTFSISKPGTVIRTLDHKYIKDMYGTEIVEKVLIPEQKVVVEENWAYFSGDFYSIPGLKVNVTFDGVDYVTEPIYEDGDAIYHAKFTTNDGLIVDITNDRYIDIDEPNGYTHTIKVYIMEEHVKQIDNKYIKDMYGEEVAETVLVPEQEIVVEYSGTSHMNTGYFGWLNTGATYNVLFDGEIYTTEPCYMDGDAVYHAKFTTNNGMEVDIDDSNAVYTNEPDGTAHTIKISIFETKLTKIDEKFIPDTIARTEDLKNVGGATIYYASLDNESAIYKDESYTELPTADEVVEAMKKGHVILKVSLDDGMSVISPLNHIFDAGNTINAVFGLSDYQFIYAPYR